MHDVTPSEAATLLSVLAKNGAGEKPDSNPSGLPASTFYAIRRKIYDAGWLSDRFVPDPWACGVAGVDFALLKPSPVDRIRLERAWFSSSENVVLWSGLNIIFGVFFRRSAPSPTIESGSVVTVTAERGSIPVYFDYSQPWSRFIHGERETGYPRSLGETTVRNERTLPSAVSELIFRDQTGGDGSASGRRWHSVAGLTRSQQRLLDRGIIRSRTLLNLGSLPPYGVRRLGEIVFLTGRFRDDVSSTDVLGALNNECQVSPILLAADGSNVLIIGLGQIEAGTSGRARVARSARPVAATLDGLLQKIELTVEHTESVRKLVEHRYDRLFSGGIGVEES